MSWSCCVHGTSRDRLLLMSSMGPVLRAWDLSNVSKHEHSRYLIWFVALFPVISHGSSCFEKCISQFWTKPYLDSSGFASDCQDFQRRIEVMLLLRFVHCPSPASKYSLLESAKPSLATRLWLAGAIPFARVKIFPSRIYQAFSGSLNDQLVGR